MPTNSNNNGKHLREYFKKVDKAMKKSGAKDLSGVTKSTPSSVTKARSAAKTSASNASGKALSDSKARSAAKKK